MNTQKNNVLIFSCIGFLMTMLALNLFTWFNLPAGQMIPIHWNIHNQADGFAGKGTVILILSAAPVVMLVVFLAVLSAIKKDPKMENLQNSMKVFNTVVISVFMMVAVIHLVIILNIFHHQVDIGKAVNISMGLLYMVMGNFLGKVRSNHTMAFRLPWTLKSEDCWNKTHRFGGAVCFVAGAVILISSLLKVNPYVMPFIVAGNTLGSVIVIVIYSFIISKRQNS